MLQLIKFLQYSIEIMKLTFLDVHNHDEDIMLTRRSKWLYEKIRVYNWKTILYNIDSMLNLITQGRI